MATTPENFIKRYNEVRQSVIDAMDAALRRAINNNVLDFDNMADNYCDVYPLIGAVLQRQEREVLEGSSYSAVIRKQKRQATKYRCDFRLWHDYAGDYNDTQI